MARGVVRTAAAMRRLEGPTGPALHVLGRPGLSCVSTRIEMRPQHAWASLAAQMVKPPPANSEDVRDTGLIPGSGRCSGGGNWQLTPIFLPGESHGQRRLEGYGPWDHKESDMTEQLTLSGVHAAPACTAAAASWANHQQENDKQRVSGAAAQKMSPCSW